MVYGDAYEVYERLHKSNPLGPPDAVAVAGFLERDCGKAARKEFMNGMNLLHKGLEQHTVDLELVRVLVRYHPAALSHKDDNGYLPIHHALHSAPPSSPPIQLDLIKFLIEEAPETILDSTSSGALPVHLACCHFGNNHDSQLSIVRYLVQLYPDALGHRDKRGRFPLHYALVSDQNMHILRFLTERYPLALEFVNPATGHLPIQSMLQEQTSRNDEVVALFVQSCPGTVRFQDVKGYTPLAFACEYDAPLGQIYSILRAWPEQVSPTTNTFTTDEFNGELLPTTLMGDTFSRRIVQLWIQQSPYVVSHPDSQGRIPLHYAALSTSQRALELVECLFHADASTLHFMDHHGRLALHYAAAAGNATVVQFMVDTDPSLLTQIDRDRCLPWHYAEYARIDEQGELYERTLQALKSNWCLEEWEHDYYSLIDSDMVPEEIRWDVLHAQDDR